MPALDLATDLEAAVDTVKASVREYFCNRELITLLELERLRRALERCKEQRNAYFSIASTVTQDKDNLDDDVEIRKILKGEP